MLMALTGILYTKISLEITDRSKEISNGILGKILVGKDGKPIDRFGSMTSPSSKKLIKAIEEALEG
jgi:glutathione peroxidase-family protein